MYVVHVHVCIHCKYIYMYMYMYQLELELLTMHIVGVSFLSEKPSNTVTPFVTVNNVNKKQTNTNKQCEQQGEQENSQTSVTTEDDDFQNNLSSKVVAKGNQTKSAGSKAVVKSTKGTKQSARSKGAVKVMKCTVVAGQRGKAGSRSSKKALVKNAMAAKKGSVCVVELLSIVRTS